MTLYIVDAKTILHRLDLLRSRHKRHDTYENALKLAHFMEQVFADLLVENGYSVIYNNAYEERFEHADMRVLFEGVEVPVDVEVIGPDRLRFEYKHLPPIVFGEKVRGGFFIRKSKIDFVKVHVIAIDLYRNRKWRGIVFLATVSSNLEPYVVGETMEKRGWNKNYILDRNFIKEYKVVGYVLITGTMKIFKEKLDAVLREYVEKTRSDLEEKIIDDILAEYEELYAF